MKISNNTLFSILMSLGLGCGALVVGSGCAKEKARPTVASESEVDADIKNYNDSHGSYDQAMMRASRDFSDENVDAADAAGQKLIAAAETLASKYRNGFKYTNRRAQGSITNLKSAEEAPAKVRENVAAMRGQHGRVKAVRDYISAVAKVGKFVPDVVNEETALKESGLVFVVEKDAKDPSKETVTWNKEFSEAHMNFRLKSGEKEEDVRAEQQKKLNAFLHGAAAHMHDASDAGELDRVRQKMELANAPR